MNELATILTADEIKEKCLTYMDSLGFGKNLTNQQKTTFIEIAQAYQLNPFKREIYAVGYKSGDTVTLSIITGYEVYIKRAERTGKLDGWKTELLENGDHKLTIWRKDWREPFEYTLKANEFVGTSPIWKNKNFMHEKVCISQGFRRCFPDEMGGLPYTEEEDDFLHGTPVKTNSEDDPMKKKRDKTQEYVQKLFGDNAIPDNILVAIDNAENQTDLNKIEFDVEQDLKRPQEETIPPEQVNNDETEKGIKEHIKKGWSELGYTFVHQKNSMLRPENLGVDKLDDCHDLDKLKAYYQHLLDIHKRKQQCKKDEIPFIDEEIK